MDWMKYLLLDTAVSLYTFPNKTIILANNISLYGAGQEKN